VGPSLLDTQAMIRRRRLWINETHVSRGWCIRSGILAFFPELAVGFSSLYRGDSGLLGQDLATQLGFACVLFSTDGAEPEPTC
jgi:hypothetical protein